MQKLIIIRGHPGSGKSTFAQQKITEYLKDYPMALIYHIENDKYLEQNGQYHWTKENFKNAKFQAQQQLKQAFKTAQHNPHFPLCIVISNVGVNANVIYRHINTAKKLGITAEVYRMQNFFNNIHHVSTSLVYDMYIKINQSPIGEEIFVPAIQPIDQKTVELIED